MKTIVQNIRSRSRRREEADTALGMESRLQPAVRSYARQRNFPARYVNVTGNL